MSRKKIPAGIMKAIYGRPLDRKEKKEIGQGRPTARATQRTTELKEVALSVNLRQAQSAGAMEKNLREFEFGECHILLGFDSKEGWHLSISHPTRYPMWDEIAEAKFRLIPDEVTVGLLIPPQAEWVNMHQNCFHLWQVAGVAELMEAQMEISALKRSIDLSHKFICGDPVKEIEAKV